MLLKASGTLSKRIPAKRVYSPKHFVSKAQFSGAIKQGTLKFQDSHFFLQVPVDGQKEKLFGFEAEEKISTIAAVLIKENPSIGDVVIASTNGKRLPYDTKVIDVARDGFLLSVDNESIVVKPEAAMGSDVFQWTSKTGEDEIRDLMIKPAILQIRSWLEKDPRKQIPLKEYWKKTDSFEISRSEASVILKSFHNSGIIFHWSSNDQMKDTIILHPDRLTKEIYSKLGIEIRKKENARIQAQIEKLMPDFKKLNSTKESLDKSAHSSAWKQMWFTLAVMTGQFAFLARCTWIEYNWDIMEPLTYFVTLATAILGLTFFAKHKTEYTYMTTVEIIEAGKAKKLYQKANLDIEKWQLLNSKITDLRTKLQDPYALIGREDIEGSL